MPGQADNDVTPPTLQSASFVSNTIHLVFSESVTLASPSGVSITELVSGNFVAPEHFDAQLGNTVNFGLSSPADGIYSVMLPASSVHDHSNNALTSNVLFTFLLIAGGDTLVLPSTSSTYSISQMYMGSAATLDIKNDTINYAGGDPGAWNGTAYTGVSGLIASGRNGGSWNGTGIISSSPAAGVFSTVGILNNGNSLTIARTYAGDGNLDGVINGDDYFLIDSNVGTVGGSVNYQSGDFNFERPDRCGRLTS